MEEKTPQMNGSKYIFKMATSRFQSSLEGIEWDVMDTYAAQTMCPYETVGALQIN